MKSSSIEKLWTVGVESIGRLDMVIDRKYSQDMNKCEKCFLQDKGCTKHVSCTLIDNNAYFVKH